MIDISRELVAYALIGAIVIIAIPVVISTRRRRRLEKLRRRGIKDFGH